MQVTLRLVRSLRGFWLPGLVLALLAGAPASAVPILFATGVNGSGVALPVGSVDPHFSLSGPASTAVVIQGHPAWVVPPAGARWIGPANGGTSGPAGVYAYSISFDTTGLDLATVQVTGSWATDDEGEIFLNGVSTGIKRLHTAAPWAFGSLQSFTIASGFTAGVNTLQFRVTNGAAGPTGLLVANLAGSGVAVIPEPASGLLVALGCTLLAGLRRRSR